MKKKNASNQVRSQVGNQVGLRVRNQVWGPVYAMVDAQVRDLIEGSAIRWRVERQIADKISVQDALDPVGFRRRYFIL